MLYYGHMADAHEKIAQQAERVEQSAQHLARSADAVEDSADRTTRLAADRTVLAAERTYAAWIRTGLAALASGVGAKALLAQLVPDWFATLTGSVLIAFSGFCFVAAVWRELKQGAPPPRPDVMRLPNALLFIVNGFLVIVALAAFIAIWMVPSS